ncbi:MAG: GMC family oxidoreductase N-terminal domain-containing protein, partial [Bacteroidota bacterium]
MKKLANLLASSLLGFTWGGPLKPIISLNKTQITQLLNKWKGSKIHSFRKSYNSVIKLCSYFYYTKINEQKRNPNWSAIQYKGDLGYKPVSHSAIQPLDITNDITLSTDYLIIGTGCGGGVVASILSKNNKELLIVEKGPFKMPMHLNHLEGDMHNTLYEQRALLNSNDGSTSVLAGSCFGGGSTVNWAGAFQTPDYILHEWSRQYANPHFESKEYTKGFDYVKQWTGIHSNLTKHNPQNQLLWDIAQKQNLNPEIIPRNTKLNDQLNDHWQWVGQGYSSLGNSFRIKQSTAVTFLEYAAQRGSKILCDTEIQSIKIKNGKATEAIGLHKSGHYVCIKAKHIVVAAGSIHSPAILKRSGIRHTALGKNLYLHPTAVISGVFEQKIDSWFGPMMT